MLLNPAQKFNQINNNIFGMKYNYWCRRLSIKCCSNINVSYTILIKIEINKLNQLWSLLYGPLINNILFKFEVKKILSW